MTAKTPYKPALQVAVDLLARREHTVLELSRKLQQRGFGAEEIDAAIDKLQAKNLLSEERFTESYINMRRRKGYGPLRIEQELRQRGVGDELIDELLDRNHRQWRQSLAEQYQRKYGDNAPQDYAEKAKRTRYLHNRGFPLDWILKVDSLDDV